MDTNNFYTKKKLETQIGQTQIYIDCSRACLLLLTK